MKQFRAYNLQKIEELKGVENDIINPLSKEIEQFEHNLFHLKNKLDTKKVITNLAIACGSIILAILSQSLLLALFLTILSGVTIMAITDQTNAFLIKMDQDEKENFGYNEKREFCSTHKTELAFHQLIEQGFSEGITPYAASWVFDSTRVIKDPEIESWLKQYRPSIDKLLKRNHEEPIFFSESMEGVTQESILKKELLEKVDHIVLPQDRLSYLKQLLALSISLQEKEDLVTDQFQKTLE